MKIDQNVKFTILQNEKGKFETNLQQYIRPHTIGNSIRVHVQCSMPNIGQLIKTHYTLQRKYVSIQLL